MTVSPLDLHKDSSRAYGTTLAGVPSCAGECRRVCGNLVGTPPRPGLVGFLWGRADAGRHRVLGLGVRLPRAGNPPGAYQPSWPAGAGRRSRGDGSGRGRRIGTRGSAAHTVKAGPGTVDAQAVAPAAASIMAQKGGGAHARELEHPHPGLAARDGLDPYPVPLRSCRHYLTDYAAANRTRAPRTVQ